MSYQTQKVIKEIVKPKVLSPNSINQQAFRNYSVRGIQKGSSEVMINKMNHLKNLNSQGSNKLNFRTIMTNSNVSSANGIKVCQLSHQTMLALKELDSF